MLCSDPEVSVLTIFPYCRIYLLVKTTIDLPDALLHEAKIAAAQRRTSLKALVEQGLEFVLHGIPVPAKADSLAKNEQDFYEIDPFNVPVLKRRGVTVTDEWVNGIRDEEGI